MNLKPIPLPPEINTNSLEELSRSMDELSKWSDSFRRSQYENLRSSAGPIADKFILSEEAAIKGFESTDCNVCLAALYALEFHWPPSLQAMQALKHLARQSPYETVVSAALAYLSRYYHGSKEVEVARLMAQVVSSSAYSNPFRGNAYMWLIRVWKGDVFAKIKWVEGVPFPNGIDWEFVRALLEEKPGEGENKEIADR